jgi:hypothetical protein
MMVRQIVAGAPTSLEVAQTTTEETDWVWFHRKD